MSKKYIILILILLAIVGIFYFINTQKEKGVGIEGWKRTLEDIATTKGEEDKENENVEWPGPFKELDTTEFDKKYKPFEDIDPYTTKFYVWDLEGNVYYNTSYSKDEKHLVKLEGAEKEYFSRIDMACSVEKSYSLFVKDNDQVFVGYREISKDPDNFKILEKVLPEEGMMPSSQTIAKDSNNYYLGCGNKLVTEDNLDTSTSNLSHIGGGIFSDGTQNYRFRERKLEDNLYTKNVTFDAYIIKSLNLSNGQVFTYELPLEHKDKVVVQAITKASDSYPENYAEGYDGPIEYTEVDEYISPVPAYINGGWYSFVTSTNYKWNVYEVPINNNSHIELSYSYKNFKDAISLRDWIDIIFSVAIK
jgi:hypothetical protein